MQLSTKIFIGFALIIVFSISGSIVDIKLSDEVHRNTEFLTHSESVIRNSVKLHKTIIEMQSAFRGYLLTNNENFLISFNSGLKEGPQLFIEEKRLLINTPSQLNKVQVIELLHLKWVKYATELISAKQRSLNTTDNHQYNYLFENKLQKEFGQKLNNTIAEKFKELDKAEYRIRENRRVTLAQSIKNTRLISFILIFFVAGTGLIGALYITRSISKRIFTMVDLADRISKGEFKTLDDKANDELKQLSISLNSMSTSLSKNFSDLEKKNKELDQFAYVVSHDLKAPLRGLYNIFTWIEEDLGTELSDSLKKYHALMKDRVHRLESLITGLLDYARIGKGDRQIETINVDSLLKDVIEMVVPPGFNVTLKTNMPVVVTEKISLTQVFSNLLSNAVKFNKNDHGNIFIGCSDAGRYYEFTVADDGIGIAPEYHERIFTIFQTLREKNQKESTGIGLAIVKKIIDDHQGDIRIISDIGKGAIFIFTWPKKT
jgi:signal transduction histidine kinase